MEPFPGSEGFQIPQLNSLAEISYHPPVNPWQPKPFPFDHLQDAESAARSLVSSSNIRKTNGCLVFDPFKPYPAIKPRLESLGLGHSPEIGNGYCLAALGFGLGTRAEEWFANKELIRRYSFIDVWMFGCNCIALMMICQLVALKRFVRAMSTLQATQVEQNAVLWANPFQAQILPSSEHGFVKRAKWVKHEVDSNNQFLLVSRHIHHPRPTSVKLPRSHLLGARLELLLTPQCVCVCVCVCVPSGHSSPEFSGRTFSRNGSPFRNSWNPQRWVESNWVPFEQIDWVRFWVNGTDGWRMWHVHRVHSRLLRITPGRRTLRSFSWPKSVHTQVYQTKRLSPSFSRTGCWRSACDWNSEQLLSPMSALSKSSSSLDLQGSSGTVHAQCVSSPRWQPPLDQPVSSSVLGGPWVVKGTMSQVLMVLWSIQGCNLSCSGNIQMLQRSPTNGPSHCQASISCTAQTTPDRSPPGQSNAKRQRANSEAAFKHSWVSTRCVSNVQFPWF